MVSQGYPPAITQVFHVHVQFWGIPAFPAPPQQAPIPAQPVPAPNEPPSADELLAANPVDPVAAAQAVETPSIYKTFAVSGRIPYAAFSFGRVGQHMWCKPTPDSSTVGVYLVLRCLR
jgi:hypothetical protein